MHDKQSSPQEYYGLNSVSDQSSQLRSKPILKHRSISDLLTGALPSLSHTDDDGENDLESEDEDEAIHSPPSRPPLLHTKSDSNVQRWASNRPFRKDSPPRIIASIRQPRSSEVASSVIAPPMDERSGSSDSARETTSSSQDLSCPPGGKKKHISFNTFVEQCIAIDSPPKPRRGSLPRETRGLSTESYDDGSVDVQWLWRVLISFVHSYDEDSENGFNDPDDALDEGELFSEAHNGSDSDEEGDILEMRSSLCRSRSSSSSRSPGAEYSRGHPPFPYPHSRPPLIRTASSDKEHVTIAPIAPTLLKTTGVGNHFVVTDLGGQQCTPPTPPVDLVYVPSFASGYGLPRKSSAGIYGEANTGDDVYRHKGGRFSSSPGSSTSTSASSNSRSPPPAIPAAEALPIPRVKSPPTIESPMGAHNESYGYHGSAAAAQVLSTDLPISMRQADLGADFGPDEGALGVRLGRAVDMPEVIVVNDETGAIEERCESRPRSRSHSRSQSRSHSRTPSPAEAKAASTETDARRTRSASPAHSSPSPHPLPQDAVYLSPPDSYPSRGRTPPGMPPRSWSFSNDGHSPGELRRGRSVTRNSSFSDRERSSSRTSSVYGTGSPLGSVSPTGHGNGSTGNGIYSVYAQGCNVVQPRNDSAEGTGSRERGRTDRRSGVSETSISPPRKGSRYEGTLSPVPSVDTPVSTPISPTFHAAASSVPSSSTLPPQRPDPPASPTVSKSTISIPILASSPPTTEEDKHSRVASSLHAPSVLRHVSLAVPAPPTSATASVLAEKPQLPSPASFARDSLTPPGSPSEHGTFAGRAAEIVSTARGLLGVLWSGSSTSPGVP